MGHVVQHAHAPFMSRTGALRIHQIPAWQDNLIWLAECMKTGDVAVIDGPEAGPTLAYLHTNGLKLTTIFNTHTHGDHIGINRDLGKRGLLDGLRVVGSKLAPTDIPGLTEEVVDGQCITFGACKGEVILTEGHINGHVSYLFDGVLFCGDTLFAGGCGYLFDGPPAKMYRSLKRLAALDGDTFVCCAHEYTQDNLRFAFSVDPHNEALKTRIRDVWIRRSRGECVVPSTMALERATNPFMQFGASRLAKMVAKAMPGTDLGSEANLFAATRNLKDRKDYRALDDSSLPLLTRHP